MVQLQPMYVGPDRCAHSMIVALPLYEPTRRERVLTDVCVECDQIVELAVDLRVPYALISPN